MAGRKNSEAGTTDNGIEGVNDDAKFGPSVEPGSLGGGSDGNGDGGSAGDNFARDGDGNIIRNRDGSPRRKRGRKAGTSANRNPSQKAGDLKGAVEGLTKAIAIIHVAAANATRSPELILDDEESKLLANATVNVLNQYDIRPDPKLEALLGLFGTAAIVYGPRIVMIRKRVSEEKAPKVEPVGEVVAGPGFAVHQ